MDVGMVCHYDYRGYLWLSELALMGRTCILYNLLSL